MLRICLHVRSTCRFRCPLYAQCTRPPALSQSSLCRGEAQAKSGKKDQTQGHLRKKIADMQRQIKQTAANTSK